MRVLQFASADLSALIPSASKDAINLITVSTIFIIVAVFFSCFNEHDLWISLHLLFPFVCSRFVPGVLPLGQQPQKPFSIHSLRWLVISFI